MKAAETVSPAVISLLAVPLSGVEAICGCRGRISLGDGLLLLIGALDTPLLGGHHKVCLTHRDRGEEPQRSIGPRLRRPIRNHGRAHGANGLGASTRSAGIS